mgnify:CR=1 FL=1
MATGFSTALQLWLCNYHVDMAYHLQLLWIRPWLAALLVDTLHAKLLAVLASYPAIALFLRAAAPVAGLSETASLADSSLRRVIRGQTGSGPAIHLRLLWCCRRSSDIQIAE